MLHHMLADTPEQLSGEDDEQPTPPQTVASGSGPPARENGAHAHDQAAK